MPMGKGTYGSQKGRPKKREKMMGGGMYGSKRKKMMGGGMYGSKRKKMMMGGTVDFADAQSMEKKMLGGHDG
tara:strand:+ start:276 stop:491 length:216 start_codon:yes stop_codon:yes gene_type:complete